MLIFKSPIKIELEQNKLIVWKCDIWLPKVFIIKYKYELNKLKLNEYFINYQIVFLNYKF